jgi:hypothetical protein
MKWLAECGWLRRISRLTLQLLVKVMRPTTMLMIACIHLHVRRKAWRAKLIHWKAIRGSASKKMIHTMKKKMLLASADDDRQCVPEGQWQPVRRGCKGIVPFREMMMRLQNALPNKIGQFELFGKIFEELASSFKVCLQKHRGKMSRTTFEK